MPFMDELHSLVSVLCDIDINQKQFKDFIKFIYLKDWKSIQKARNSNRNNFGSEDVIQLIIKNNINSVTFNYEKTGCVKQSSGKVVDKYLYKNCKDFIYPPSGGKTDENNSKKVDLWSQDILLEIKFFHQQSGPWAHFDTQLAHLFNNPISPHYLDHSISYNTKEDALNPTNTGLQIMPFVKINNKEVITFILAGQILYDIAKMLNFKRYGDDPKNSSSNPFKACEIYSILFFKPNMYKNINKKYLSNLKNNISNILISYANSPSTMILKADNKGQKVHGIECIKPNNFNFWYKNSGNVVGKPIKNGTNFNPVELFCQGSEMCCILIQTLPAP